jgi:hypothetical protein
MDLIVHVTNPRYQLQQGKCANALSGRLIITDNINRALPYPSATALSGHMNKLIINNLNAISYRKHAP